MNSFFRLTILCGVPGVVCAGRTAKKRSCVAGRRDLCAVDSSFANTLAREVKQSQTVNTSTRKKYR